MFRLLTAASAALLLTACGSGSTPAERPAAAPGQASRSGAAAAPSAARPPAASPATPADSLRQLNAALARVNDSVQVESFQAGDLNADGRPDYLVLARGKEPCGEATEESYCRTVYIVLNQGAAGLRVAAANSRLVDCSDCGGAGTGDPFQNFVIKGTFFSVETALGSCDKSYTTTTFRYNRARRDWLLHRLDTRGISCRDTTNEAGVEDHQTVRDFGIVTFSKYQAEQ